MLVLLSFGLVLVATVLLVLGLLSDSGLTLIYVSIAASALAGVVLIVAVRLSKPKATTPEAPAPLGDEEVAEAARVDAASPPPPVDTMVVPVAQVEEQGATPEPPEDQWADSAPEWEVDEDDGVGEPAGEDVDVVEFPIAEYDDLNVNEILPLLPQLYSDELDIVEEREKGTKDRVTILGRIAELRETGTEADEAFAAEHAAALAADEESDTESDTDASPSPDTAPDEFGADDDDDFGVDDDFFPIEGYDSLTVGQITPLLDQLEDDELEDVRARELAGDGRITILRPIEDRIGPATPQEKTPAKKPAAKKRAAKKPAAKKRAAKKPAAKKRAAKKRAAKKRATKKRIAKKAATAKKTPTAQKKSPANKRVANKRAAKKRIAKKAATARKSAQKKSPAKKRAPRKR